jgi:hypothetical protein
MQHQLQSLPHQTQFWVTFIFHPSSQSVFLQSSFTLSPSSYRSSKRPLSQNSPSQILYAFFDSPIQHIPCFCNSLCTSSTLLCLKRNNNVTNVVTITTMTKCGSSGTPKQRKAARFQAADAVYLIEVYLHSFLTSALNGGAWSASCPDRFTLGERAAGTLEYEAGWAPHPVWTLWWMEKKKKIPCPCRESIIPRNA